MPGPVILDLPGIEVSPEDKEILQHPLVGGVILFARNYESPTQIEFLCKKIRESRQAPLLIAVDQEGGRVQRFREGMTVLPAMGAIGSLFEKNPAMALEHAETCGWLMAAEILALGIDLSFAPVLDLNKQKNKVVADRSFHRNADIVIQLARKFIAGMREVGMAATGKHFPGHGDVVDDSHERLPIDQRDFVDIVKEDLKPFSLLIQEGINAIMPAHILFPKVDAEKPVGFSHYWLQDVLRKQLGFLGTIFSDDLNMIGAGSDDNYHQRAAAAIDAGCDFALICNNRKAALQILDRYQGSVKVGDQKFKSLQGKFSHNYTALKQSRVWREKNNLFLKIQEQL
ncbi:hypothetical protein AYO45_06185 [Gammaproteobacteria bacterium SCGC AG-212-F23]|nr:hypothetical protein AYO45_06185 [Gammaproteobacteria bacterium SCGC AG-212-F23]